MDERQGLHSVLGVLEQPARGEVLKSFGLEGEEARDELEIVFDMMVHFFEQQDQGGIRVFQVGHALLHPLFERLGGLPELFPQLLPLRSRVPQLFPEVP